MVGARHLYAFQVTLVPEAGLLLLIIHCCYSRVIAVPNRLKSLQNAANRIAAAFGTGCIEVVYFGSQAGSAARHRI